MGLNQQKQKMTPKQGATFGRFKETPFIVIMYAKLGKGLRGFRAIALPNVFSKWYSTVLVDLLHEEKGAIEWMSLHVGAETGVNCEHMQALVTNIVAGFAARTFPM